MTSLAEVETQPRRNERSIPRVGGERGAGSPSLLSTQRLDKVEFEATTTAPEATQKFDYYAKRYTATEFAQLLGNEDQTRIKEALKARGLSDIGFTIYLRKAESTSAEEFERKDRKIVAEQLRNTSVYLLLHGWTATEKISSDVRTPDGFTIVERILRKDPTGLVVTMDAGGSGRSTFTDEVLANNKELKKRLAVDEYVEQAHTLLVDILGMTDMSKLRIKGHSRGGAAAIRFAMKYGCGVAEADAPAFLLASPWRKLIKSELQLRGWSQERSKKLNTYIEEIWDTFPYNPTIDGTTDAGKNAKDDSPVYVTAELLYRGLGKSIGFGALVARIGRGWEKIGSGITSLVFQRVLKKYLLGNIVFPGFWGTAKADLTNENERMRAELGDQHQEEIVETPDRPRRQQINSFSIDNLAEGQMLGTEVASLDALDMKEFQRLASVQIFAAEKDTLATLSGMQDAIGELALLALLKYERIKESLPQNDQGRVDMTQLNEAALGYIGAVKLYKRIQVIAGGHYATFFTPQFEEALIRRDKIVDPVAVMAAHLQNGN